MNKSTMTNYVVVANKDGGEVNLSDMQEKLEEMKDMLLLPSLQDSVSKSNPSSFFLIHPKKLGELKKMSMESLCRMLWSSLIVRYVYVYLVVHELKFLLCVITHLLPI